jgi:hypothetical protein
MWLSFATALLLAGGGTGASAHEPAGCPVPRLTHAQKHRAHVEIRREARRRRREGAPDLMGYRDGPALGRPDRRERRDIADARAERSLVGLNPRRLLIRRLLRADSPAIRKSWELIAAPMTSLELRDYFFQQDRVVESQSRIERYGRRCVPQTYAGEYTTVRWREGIRVHVLFTKSRGKYGRRLAARYPYAALMKVHRARFTLRYLNALQRRIDADWDELHRQGIQVSLTGVRVEYNAVELVIPHPSHEDRTELRRRYGTAIRIVQGEVDELARGKPHI